MTTKTISACSGCGTPLTEDGSIDIARLAEAASERSQTFAIREDRAQVEARLAIAQTDLETAKRHKDAAALPYAARCVEELAARVQYIDGQLSTRPDTPAAPEGNCPDCGTPFRGGRADLAAIEQIRIEQSRQRSNLEALERELEAAHRSVECAQNEAELAAERAASGRRPGAERAQAAMHSERAERAQARIPEIEQAILRVRGELEGRAPAARASNRAYVGRKSRGERRA